MLKYVFTKLKYHSPCVRCPSYTDQLLYFVCVFILLWPSDWYERSLCTSFSVDRIHVVLKCERNNVKQRWMISSVAASVFFLFMIIIITVCEREYSVFLARHIRMRRDHHLHIYSARRIVRFYLSVLSVVALYVCRKNKIQTSNTHKQSLLEFSTERRTL